MLGIYHKSVHQGSLPPVNERLPEKNKTLGIFAPVYASPVISSKMMNTQISSLN